MSDVGNLMAMNAIGDMASDLYDTINTLSQNKSKMEKIWYEREWYRINYEHFVNEYENLRSQYNQLVLEYNDLQNQANQLYHEKQDLSEKLMRSERYGESVSKRADENFDKYMTNGWIAVHLYRDFKVLLESLLKEIEKNPTQFAIFDDKFITSLNIIKQYGLKDDSDIKKRLKEDLQLFDEAIEKLKQLKQQNGVNNEQNH